jgi:hypothetical protein
MEDDNDELSEEDILKASQAYLVFVNRFSEYVKEVDMDLWLRAREYAADFTKIPGVTIELVDEDEDEDGDDNHKHGAD